MSDTPRCVITGNPCGTDTVISDMRGADCPSTSGKCVHKRASDTPRTDALRCDHIDATDDGTRDLCEETYLHAETLERELSAAQAEIERLREDAERYRWMRDNAGRWDCIPDNSKWTLPDGTKRIIKARFSAFDAAYLGYDFEEALTLAIDKARRA